MALAGTVAFTSCSKDDDDDVDAIVGTWISESSISVDGRAEQTDREVWKFNADSTGSYSNSSNATVVEESDFNWTKKDSKYQIDYSNADLSDEAFGIGELLGEQTLEDEEGYMIAVRE